MRKIGGIVASAILAMACAPESAYAASEGAVVPSWLPWASGLLSLLVALMLLGAVLRLRRLVFGAAISAYTSYVVAAVMCLVASALVHWLGRLLPSVSTGQTVLASSLLVTAAMGLLVLYFTNVRSRLVGFARDLRGSMDEGGQDDQDDAEGLHDA